MNTHEAFLETTEIDGKTINVYGVWNNTEDYKANKDPDYYDVYAHEPNAMIGVCLNEDNPLREKPTVADCEQLLKEYLKD